MRNIAIVLGVSEYQNAADLPACKNDVAMITRILHATKKYEVLVLDEASSKQQILDQIEAAILPNDSESDVGEFLFYFSGHGVQDDEVHFILNNTVLDRINSTALNNSEIDELARKCSPKLYVKIVDACQSGFAYIKAPFSTSEELSLAPLLLEKSLDNCIFMSSSKKEQLSIATNEYSIYTQAFVNAVLDCTEQDTIYYSDIQNIITDTFSSRNLPQTPYYTNQGVGRAVFSHTTQELKELAKEKETTEAQIPGVKSETELSIDNFLALYRDETYVKEMLSEIKSIMCTTLVNSNWFQKYYNVSFESYSYEDPRTDSKIIRFLYSRKTENLFVEFEPDKTDSENIFGLPSLSLPKRYNILALNLPSVFSYHMLPKYEALPRYEVSFVFVYSDTYMYILNASRQYVRKGWGEYALQQSTNYTYKALMYSSFDKDEWKEYVDSRLNESIAFIEKTLLTFLGK